MFENINFIKADMPFVKEYDREKSPCVIFKKKFEVENIDNIKSSKVFVCGLGYGYYYINGRKITQDLFTAPVSDYNKTLWYNSYDAAEFLHSGQNIFTVICGNGFYNESLNTPWNFNHAVWRDNPKFILKLEINGETILVSDNTWKCTAETPVVFNQLRSGEHFDSRLYNPNFNQINFDDSRWDYAIADSTPPKGVFRECLCEPIRECAEYKTINIIQTGPMKYVFDIGQNVSGYIRLKVNQNNGNSGDLLAIRYAETVNADYSLQMNGMIDGYFYPDSEFMTDKFICNGEEFIWSPMFTYHGFRYIEIDGIKNPDSDTVSGIFVHQDIKAISDFECSDDTLNKLFKAGRMATYSNLFYMPTDCPTREKLGWANDAQASAEQMLMNFDIVNLFKKWHRDILDAMREDGSMPGIIPTGGWGYEWGNGPVSEGILFEIPYRIYLHTGDKSLLIDSLPYFERYFEFLESRKEPDGLIDYGLDDWSPPEPTKVPRKFINLVFLAKFLRIAIGAAAFAGNKDLCEKYENEHNKAVKLFFDNYVNADGTCKINEQTAVAMAVHIEGVFGKPIKEQLKKLVEERDFHHNCGMVGLPHLYAALNACGLAEYAYKIITAKGYPSYTRWLDCGATTLWETWQPGNSKNHHMYSCFMAWIMKTLVGIVIIINPGYEEVEIKPEFISALNFCRGHIDTPKGRISVEWKRRSDNTVTLKVNIPEHTNAVCFGNILKSGENIILL
ncbi:MAG: glycoside hydrolase family 78 protein [Oscillospiraceae bacterium]|nr:glycoside hydrolase family 78 protein [Oscillospiraceae bacterium]